LYHKVLLIYQLWDIQTDGKKYRKANQLTPGPSLREERGVAFNTILLYREITLFLHSGQWFVREKF